MSIKEPLVSADAHSSAESKSVPPLLNMPSRSLWGRPQDIKGVGRHTRRSSDMLSWRTRSTREYKAGDLGICLRYGEHSIQGKRNTQEDAAAAFTDLSKHVKAEEGSGSLSFSFFAIYDGHGGRQAADFVNEHLHKYLCEERRKGSELKGALERAIARVEHDFNVLAADADLTDGTTASVALIEGRRLVCASVGDSELVLSRGGKALGLCAVHNPKKNPSEAARVKAEGGVMRDDRVAHPLAPGAYSLAISRAIGDYPFKSEEMTRGKPSGVNARPDVRELELAEEDELLLVACDGLWDVLEHQQAVDLALAELAKHNDPQAAAEALVKEAYNLGSSDNISTLVITFKQFGSKQATQPEKQAEQTQHPVEPPSKEQRSAQHSA